MEASRRQEIIALAQRLAKREGVDPAWIEYPAWSGIPLGAEAILKKADDFRTWAAAILSGELTRPDWLVREEQLDAVQDTLAREREPRIPHYVVEPGRNARLKPEPTYADTIDYEAAALAWCTEEQRRAAPKPTLREVVDLARLLGQIHFFPTDGLDYPAWTDCPDEVRPWQGIADALKRWARSILAHESPPTEWMMRRDPVRWAPPPPVVVPHEERGPDTLLRAACRLRLRSIPLAVAFVLRTAFGPAPPLPARPPPSLGRWRSPHRVRRGPPPSAIPPECERVTPTLDSALWQPNSSRNRTCGKNSPTPASDRSSRFRFHRGMTFMTMRKPCSTSARQRQTVAPILCPDLFRQVWRCANRPPPVQLNSAFSTP